MCISDNGTMRKYYFFSEVSLLGITTIGQFVLKSKYIDYLTDSSFITAAVLNGVNKQDICDVYLYIAHLRSIETVHLQ